MLMHRTDSATLQLQQAEKVREYRIKMGPLHVKGFQKGGEVSVLRV